MPDVAHLCARGDHWRGSAWCGACQQPCTPHCAVCGHNLQQPGHKVHA